MQISKTRHLASLALGLAITFAIGGGEATAGWTKEWQSRPYRSTSPDEKAYTSGHISWRKAGGKEPYEYKIKGRPWSHADGCASAMVYKWQKGDSAKSGRAAILKRVAFNRPRILLL